MSASLKLQPSATKRIFVCLVVGIGAAVAAILLGHPRLAALIGWDSSALSYVCWVWYSVTRLTPSEVRSHAIQEDPGRALSDVLIIAASIASLGAVGLLVIQASGGSNDKLLVVAFGLLSVVVSWFTLQTSYTLKYARLYYGKPEGGISFNQSSPPRYADFAYLAFTIGMTFQVSDTDLSTKSIRATALRQAMLSYVFGTIIIASTINIVASLAK